MDKFDLIKKEIEELTKNSFVKEDYIHSQSVWKWVLKLKPDADIALQIAALGHDIDRSFPERRIKREDFESYDEYKKKHSLMAAKIVCELLKKFDFEKETIKKVKSLIEKHEVGGEGDVEILKEADSITFFEYNLPFYRKSHTLQETKDKIKFMYGRLSKKAKQLINQIKFKDHGIDELFKETISKI